MPVMDGMETFRIMKEMEDYPSKNVPVVILTANAIVGAKEKYLKEGFTAFLEKPIDFKKLEKMIRELLDESLLCAATAPAEQQNNEVAESPLVELPLVEGLDWKYARMHFNDDESMLDTVVFFAKSIEYDAKELEGRLTDISTESGRKNYCTKVHSMKNSASTIGIIPLAGMAKVLEDSARNDDIAVLETMTPIFLERWKSYKEKLAVFIGNDSQNDKKSADEYRAEIDELMQRMRKAAEDMDIDELDQIWNELAEYQFKEEQQDLIDQIHKAIVNFDVDFLQEVSI